MKTIFKYPIEIDVLRSRLSEVEKCIISLKELKNQYSSKSKFISDKNAYGLTEHYLRRALEGLLSCGSHILSRIPGAKFDQYAAIAAQLADYEILPKEFKETGVRMAKYRNRLVHFYHEVANDELYDILHEYLLDLEKFYNYILAFTQQRSKQE